MPKYFAVIVKDPQKNRDAEIERNVKANLPHQVKGTETFLKRPLKAEEKSHVEGKLREHLAKEAGNLKDVDDIYSFGDADCPHGLPNCRNCGDPAFAESCAADGHCPGCGTAHGVAPDSYIAASGVELVAVAAEPAEDEVWNKQAKRFTKRA